MSAKIYIYLFILISVFSTNISAQQLTLNKVSEIQPAHLLGSYITGIDVTSNGHIAVALNDIAKVRLYDREGNLQNEYGRRGRGPGDFSNDTSVQLTDSVVYALDAGPSGRIQAFIRESP